MSVARLACLSVTWLAMLAAAVAACDADTTGSEVPPPGAADAPATAASCPEGEVTCGAACSDPRTDPENCGACGTTCAASEVCNLGRCTRDGACPDGSASCRTADAAADAQTDAPADAQTDAPADAPADAQTYVPSDAGPEQADLALGGYHTCYRLPDGRVKCWGDNGGGYLGLGDTQHRGGQPGQMGEALPAVGLGAGRAARALAAGRYHTCALLDDDRIKCWGDNAAGQLGLGDAQNRGDQPGEMGDALPSVNLGSGRSARAIAAGAAHTCALLDDGQIKCWGKNTYGQLGLGDTASRGDQPGEMGDALPSVNLGAGRSARALAAGSGYTCALLDDGRLKCWGGNGAGVLGLGDTQNRGDQPGEMGDALPSVDLGAGRSPRAVSAGFNHTCARLDDHTLKCWGSNAYGQLGLGSTGHRGDQPGEMGDALPSVNLGAARSALAVSAGGDHTCARRDDDTLKCWGQNYNGELGLGVPYDVVNVANDTVSPVDLGAGRTARAVGLGGYHTCARLDDGTVKCWGHNGPGQLGLGDGWNRRAPSDAVDLGP